MQVIFAISLVVSISLLYNYFNGSYFRLLLLVNLLLLWMSAISVVVSSFITGGSRWKSSGSKSLQYTNNHLNIHADFNSFADLLVFFPIHK